MPLDDKPKDEQPPSEDSPRGDLSPPHTQAQAQAGGSDSDPLDSSGEGEVLRKRMRQHSPSPSSPGGRLHGGFSGIAASPHKNKTFEELLAAAGVVNNMALAHEIVVDGNFKLSPRDLPETSIEKKVQDIMHKAFWDSLRVQLSEDPPSYTHAVILTGEIRTTLLSLLLPHHDRLKTQILEAMDLDLIQQQADHQALDVSKLAAFVVQVMSKLCAPVRDEEIATLGTLAEPVELFREIFRVLDKMKLDMANYTLQSLRPHLKHHSIEYERKKFQDFLATQQDGLQYARQWLDEAAEKLYAQVKKQQELQQQQHENQPSSSGASNLPVISPAAILSHAYINLLNRDPAEAMTFPETVLMDQGRFYEMGSKVKKLVLVGCILLVTYTNTGSLLSGIQGFPSQLKHNLFILLEGVSDFGSVMESLADQVCREVCECLKTHGYAEWDALRIEAFKTQLRAITIPNNNIFNIIDSRVRGFLVSAVSAPSRFDPSSNIPPGLSTMESQLLDVTKALVRIVSHNRSVFGPFYAEILTKMVQPQPTS